MLYDILPSFFPTESPGFSLLFQLTNCFESTVFQQLARNMEGNGMELRQNRTWDPEAKKIWWEKDTDTRERVVHTKEHGMQEGERGREGRIKEAEKVNEQRKN